MRLIKWIVIGFFLFVGTACREITPPPSPTSTRTPPPTVTYISPTSTKTPYPSETITPRLPTNTLSTTQTQTWPQTPTRTPTITPTPTPTQSLTPSPTVTGTPPTQTPSPTFTVTPSPTKTPSSGPRAWVNPPIRTINGLGQSGQVIIQLSNFTGVYGMELLVSFDPDVVRVEDALPSKSGVQVAPGNCPAPDQNPINVVDNEAGTIDYTAVQQNPTIPCNGGIVMIIEFQCLIYGTSNVSLDDALVTTINGIQIDHVLEDGIVNCQP